MEGIVAGTVRGVKREWADAKEADNVSRSQTGAPRCARRSTPPYNPGLQKLVDAKQSWAVPLAEDAKVKGFLGWHQRGYLPHYDTPGVTQVWEREYLDTVIEDHEHRQTAMRYIEKNPAKAGLVLDPKEWPWSSARFRDEYGVLKLPQVEKPVADRRSAEKERRLTAGPVQRGPR